MCHAGFVKQRGPCVLAPNDPTRPLILPDTAFARKNTIFGASVDDINYLSSKGYSADTLLADLAAFQALASYAAQVNNGSHSQFAHHSGNQLFTCLERAEPRPRRFALPELADEIGRYAKRCRTIAGEALQQDGSDTRAADLDSQDKALVAMEFGNAGLASYPDTPDRCDPKACALSSRFRLLDEDVPIDASEAGINLRTKYGEPHSSVQTSRAYRNEGTHG